MRTAEDLTAIILIGDGIIGALTPSEHVRRYEAGPDWWRLTMRWFAKRPGLTRSLAVVEAALGVLLAVRLARR